MNLRRFADATRSWSRRSRLPRRTVRLRLTLLYGALFATSGAALSAVTYILVWRATSPRLPSNAVRHERPEVQAKVALEIHQHATLMHQVLVSCAISLAITAVLSIALGWLVAGRVLRPLRTMTAATQRIGEQNLHERLAVTGPDDELKQLGDIIDELLGRLEAAFNAQRRFVANASHELRTPLTMMRTAIDVATTTPEPPAPGVTVLAHRVRLGLDRADRLVESFLVLARAQHGGGIRRSVVGLDQLASAVLADHAGAIGDKHLTVQQDLQGTPAHGDQALLTHLADNLINNAIRHNHPGGWIQVTTATDGDAARLVVENSGACIDQTRVAELTQPFRRITPDRTRTDDTGVGLGLSIAAAVVNTHDGTLDLHARPAGGLRVTVTLPLATQAALTGAIPR